MERVISPQKQAILDAAQALFVQHGYAGVSISDLAERCGLAKATIYHHFRDKEEIFLSMLERDTDRVHTQLLQAIEQEQTSLAKLRAVIATYCQLVSERRSFITTLRELGSMEDKLRLFLRRHKNDFLEPLTQLLQQGIAEGVFRRLDPEMGAISLLGMINSFVGYRILLHDQELGDDVVDHTFALFLHGMENKPASQK